MTYLTPKEAAKELGISQATISNCKKAGAPVHYWGPGGRSYRIVLDEFIQWMDDRGKKAAEPTAVPDNLIDMNAESMAKRRRETLAALAG